MRASLENIARFVSGGEADAMTLAWHELRYQHTALIRATLAEAYKPATANKMISALRGVLKECFRLGYTTAEDYQRARDLPTVKGHSLPPGRSLSQGELRRLLEVCAESSKRNRGARDAAVVALLYGCGLRRSAAVALYLADYDAEAGEVRVRGAKGRKDRITYAAGGAGDAIEAWVGVIKLQERGSRTTHILFSRWLPAIAKSLPTPGRGRRDTGGLPHLRRVASRLLSPRARRPRRLEWSRAWTDRGCRTGSRPFPIRASRL